MLSKLLRAMSSYIRTEVRKTHPNVPIGTLISIPELQDEYRDKLRDDGVRRFNAKLSWMEARRRWYMVRSGWKWDKDE